MIDGVLFIGNQYVTDKRLLKESGLKQGDALNIYTVQEARRKVEEYYRSKGYTKTVVTIEEGDKPEDRRVVLRIDESPVERIWSVRFVGNDPSFVTDARLKTLIKSKPGFMKYLFRGKVDHALIAEDREILETYYRNLGYFKARISREIEYDSSGQWATLTFVIDEGPRYRIRDVSVVGNKKYSSDQLLGLLKLQTGDYFNLDKMQTGRELAARRLRQPGAHLRRHQGVATVPGRTRAIGSRLPDRRRRHVPRGQDQHPRGGRKSSHTPGCGAQSPVPAAGRHRGHPGGAGQRTAVEGQRLVHFESGGRCAAAHRDSTARPGGSGLPGRTTKPAVSRPKPGRSGDRTTRTSHDTRRLRTAIEERSAVIGNRMVTTQLTNTHRRTRRYGLLLAVWLVVVPGCRRDARTPIRDRPGSRRAPPPPASWPPRRPPSPRPPAAARHRDRARPGRLGCQRRRCRVRMRTCVIPMPASGPAVAPSRPKSPANRRPASCTSLRHHARRHTAGHTRTANANPVTATVTDNSQWLTSPFLNNTAG